MRIPGGVLEAAATCLVVIVEIDPTTQPLNDLPPLRGISHHDSPALSVVLLNPNLCYGISARHAQLLVNFVFDWNPVSVPAKASDHMISFHRPVSRYDILDGGREEVAVVRQASTINQRQYVQRVGLWSVSPVATDGNKVSKSIETIIGHSSLLYTEGGWKAGIAYRKAGHHRK